MNSIEEIRASIALNPASAEGLSAYARHLLNRGDFIRSELAARRCLCIGAADRAALNTLAYIAVTRGDDRRSMRFARQALALDPQDAGGFKMLLMSFACRQRQSPPTALSELPFFAWTRRALSFSPGDGFHNFCLFEFFRHRASAEAFDRTVDILGRQQNQGLASAAAGGEIVYVNHAQIFKFIGETAAALDCLSKLFALGMLPRGGVLGLERPEDVANHAAMALWRPMARLTDAARLATLRQKARVIDIDTTFMRFGKRFFPKDVVVAAVQRIWERQGRPPLIKASRDHWRFRQLLDSQGWRADDRIACVHIREPLYNQSLGRGIDQDFRNSDIARLEPAIADLVARGFRVVRIGRPGVAPLAPGHGILDLANSAETSDILDVQVVGTCDLYFGSASGPSSLAAAFQRPVCLVDFAQLSGPIPSGKTIYVPKLWMSRVDGRLVPLSRMLEPPFRYLTRPEVLDNEGILQIASDPDDVRAAVAETLERFVDGDDHRPRPLQDRARRILKRHKVVPLGLLSARFAARFDYWVR